MDPLLHTKLESLLRSWDGEHVIVNQEDKPSELVTKLALDAIGTTSEEVLNQCLNDISLSSANKELESKVDKLRSIFTTTHSLSREQIEKDLGLNTWVDSLDANKAKEIIITCYLEKWNGINISSLNIRFSECKAILQLALHYNSKIAVKVLLSNPYFYEKLMFSYPPTLLEKIELLFLLTGSSRSRKFGVSAPNLSTSTRPVLANIKENLLKLKEALVPDDLNHQILDKLLDEIDEATLGYLECNDYLRSIAQDFGPWIIPVNIGKHSVLIELTKEENGSFTILLFNTGYGITGTHLKQDEWDERIYPLVISGINPNAINQDFFKNLANSKLIGGSLSLSRFKPCGEFYDWISSLGTPSEASSSALNLCIKRISQIMYTDPISFEPIATDPYIRGLLIKNRDALEKMEDVTIQAFFSNPLLQKALSLPLPPSIEKATRSYYPQGEIGNCSIKCLSTWLHSSMPKSLYQQFKTLREGSLVNEIEADLARLRSQLELIDPDPATLDERVFNGLHLDPALEIKSMDHLRLFLAIAKSKNYNLP